MSIGNDIVAIKSSKPERLKLYSFYSRILSEKEQQLYQLYEASVSFEIFVWLLWSIKESVYKYLKRTDPELVFSPPRIEVEHISFPKQIVEDTDDVIEQLGFETGLFYESSVIHNGQTCYCHSSINKEYIHTVASNKQAGVNVCWGIKKIGNPHYQSQSEQVRTFVLEKLSALFPGKVLQIEKSQTDYPYITVAGVELPVPLSFSHHGYYVAYAFDATAAI